MISYSQSWEVVGSRGIVMAIESPEIKVNPINNIPYLICRNGYGVSVMKFFNSQWEYVGDTIVSEGIGSCTTLAFDNFGSPFIAYMDWSHKYRITVMKFDGTNWVTLGKAGMTPGAASYASLAFDSNQTPYVAFRDQGDTVYNSWPNGYRASVMKFNGTSWVYVGTPGFSSNATLGGAAYISLALDKNDMPYVGFTDFSNDFAAAVMKFNGTNWVQVGSAISDGQASNTHLVIDKNNTPYIAFWDRANAGKATVKKFEGSNWVNVGSEGLTNGAAEYTYLTFDKNNNLYLAYEDYANSEKASVMKFDGTNWLPVGNLGFSEGRAYYTTIAIDNNGNIYAGYKDCPVGKATVMKFQSPVVIKEDTSNEFSFEVYPNPSSNNVNFFYTGTSESDLTIKVKNVLGQKVLEKKYHSQKEIKETFDLNSHGRGLYFIELLSGDKRAARKVVVE